VKTIRRNAVESERDNEVKRFVGAPSGGQRYVRM
jgi:hypothetical protein